MFQSVTAHLRKRLVGSFAAALCSLSVLGGTAAAQTVVLNQPGSQVTDTTIRSGSFANTNFDGEPLITRRSSDPDWERRAILKFDTQNLIPPGAQIASATLTLTVKSGLGSAGQTRSLRALRISSPFQEAQATWRLRQTSSYWSTPGGDVAEEVDTATASNVAGSKVVINLTALVQRTSDGDFDSRYTRILLADAGGDAKESYREYYSSEDSTVSHRPTLTVVLGTSGGITPPPPTSTGSTLKVLQWNISQGYGQDGKSNIDRVVNWVVTINPDLISFNEIMHYASGSQVQSIADKLKARTGRTWYHKWAQISGAASGIGVAVLSRFPLEDTDSHLLSYNRSVALVKVTVNGRTIHMFSTHLDHQSSSRRLTQVRELKAWAGTFAEQRIVAGDFNWYPGTTEINEMVKSYKDGWAVAKSKGTAVSYSGNPDGNTRNTRIDYVFYSNNASALSVTSARVYDTRADQVSDHRPVLVTFKVN